MSYINCESGNDDEAPCACDCAHLASQHRIYERWLARCLVEGCICERLDACKHVQPYAEISSGQSDAETLAALGIGKP
jgi:hypothetical protein